MDFISQQDEPVSFAVISEALTIPKTTLFRILYSFVDANWLEKKNDSYTLGYGVVQIGVKYLSKLKLHRVALPHLDRLSKETGETSHTLVLSGRQGMILAVCDGPKHIRIAARPGTVTPLHCSAPGKVLLAYAVKEDLHSFFEGIALEKRTKNTITDIDRLIEETKKIRRLGYAVDEREFHDDVRCLAVPVFDAFDNVVAGVGITAVISSFTRDMIEPVYKKVHKTATDISRDLGATR
jgi:DNA-binding IclR family transcriptional regulator